MDRRLDNMDVPKDFAERHDSDEESTWTFQNIEIPDSNKRVIVNVKYKDIEDCGVCDYIGTLNSDYTNALRVAIKNATENWEKRYKNRTKTPLHDKIPLLNSGFVRYVEHMGADVSISRNARVSYDAEWRAGKDTGSDERLINRLMSHGHNTPFESCVVTFEIKAPIFVFRQWHRHRTQSYNELSARYKKFPKEFYVPELEQITTQHTDNKQMRTDEQHPEAHEIQEIIRRTCNNAFEEYDTLIEMGVPRELARSVLPVGTYSHMFVTANLHNWLKFISERNHPHAQYEIKVYSEVILNILETLYPVAVGAYKDGR